MFYILIFAVIAILLVVVVLVRNQRTKSVAESPVHRGTAGASRTSSGSAQRNSAASPSCGSSEIQASTRARRSAGILMRGSQPAW